MNSFYTAIDYLKTLFEQNELVNTVCHGVVSNIDLDKKNIYPLVHITAGGVSFESGWILHKFTVHVLEQRNVSKINSNNKWLRNDNELDNLNTCAGIFTDVIGKLHLQYNDFDIELSTVPELEPVEFAFTNTLDGWVCEMVLKVPNNTGSC